MAIFGSKRQEQQDYRTTTVRREEEERRTVSAAPSIPREIVSIPKDAALITACLSVKGTIGGCGSIIVRGHHEGDITVEETVIVDEKATVLGNILAGQIRIAGTLTGNVRCKVLEVTKQAEFTGTIECEKGHLDGNVKARIKAESSLDINRNGKIEAEECSSERIKVLGDFSG